MLNLQLCGTITVYIGVLYPFWETGCCADTEVYSFTGGINERMDPKSCITGENPVGKMD